MKIKFWKVGSADAITINFKDEAGAIKNLFIDGGYLSTYLRTIKQELLDIQAANQCVDLWIITHTDRDLIGGVEAFLKDSSIYEKDELVKQYWFNWSSYEFSPLNEKISVTQGINLRNYLSAIGKLQLTDIIENEKPIEWHGLKLTILSPNEERLIKSKIAWKESESEKLIASGLNDYNEPVDSLLKQPYTEDNDVWNGGSIAFLLEFNNKRILFLADSFPSVIIHGHIYRFEPGFGRQSTSFIPKGNQGKLGEQKSAMRSALSTVRATVLEGSFGNEKNHYLLQKVKARTHATEIALIFFGMLTANASIISKRIISHQLKRTG